MNSSTHFISHLKRKTGLVETPYRCAGQPASRRNVMIPMRCQQVMVTSRGRVFSWGSHSTETVIRRSTIHHRDFRAATAIPRGCQLVRLPHFQTVPLNGRPAARAISRAVSCSRISMASFASNDRPADSRRVSFLDCASESLFMETSPFPRQSISGENTREQSRVKREGLVADDQIQFSTIFRPVQIEHLMAARCSTRRIFVFTPPMVTALA